MCATGCSATRRRAGNGGGSASVRIDAEGAELLGEALGPLALVLGAFGFLFQSLSRLVEEALGGLGTHAGALGQVLGVGQELAGRDVPNPEPPTRLEAILALPQAQLDLEGLRALLRDGK